MEPIAFMPITHVPGCLKCGRHCKGHPLLYGNNSALALAKEHKDESRDSLSCWVEGSPVTLLPGSSPMVDHGRPGPASEASSQNSSKCDSATCSHYNYHHHKRFNWTFLGCAVNQSWPARWAVSLRQAMDRWAITATHWHYYTAQSYQQGTGPPPWEPYSYGCDDRNHSSTSVQFSQWCSPFRASSSSPTSEQCLGWGQSLNQQSSH